MLTHEQLKARKGGLGGSDIAAILGISPFKNRTPLSVYLDKISDDITETEPTAAMEFGNIMEAVLGEFYSKKTNTLVLSPKDILYKHPTHIWMIGTPDFIIHKSLIEEKNFDKILECKTVGWHSTKEWDEGIPLYYLTQIAHYAIIFNIPVDVIALINNEFKIFEYERNPELEELLIKKEQEFWYENVLKRIPPMAINLDDLKKLYKTIIPQKSLIVTDEIEAKIYEMARLKAKMNELEQQQKSLEFDIKNFMQDAEILLDKNATTLMTSTSYAKTIFDKIAFEKEHPGLLEKYQKKSIVRNFYNKIKEVN